MKITYNRNPLATVIELDEAEKKELWYKIKIAELEERMFSAHYYLREKSFDLEKARNRLDPDYWCSDEKSRLDTYVDTLHEHFIQELQSSHAGDCTAFACSCCKCHAEELIGICTIPNISKSIGHRLNSAFNRKEGDTWVQVPYQEVLQNLQGTSEGDWLLKYYNDHFHHSE